MRKNENQILVILSIGTVIALLAVIRECSYPLICNTTVMRWIFISKTEDKLMSNIAYSYIAAYLFYLMQVYIPKILNKKNITPILVPKINELNIKVYEFSFIIDQITYKQTNGLCINQGSMPLYYKIIKDDKAHIKRISNGNILVQMFNYIEELYSHLLDKFVIYNLDMSILRLWERLPLEYYRQIVEIVKLNENRQTPIVVNGLLEEDTETLHCINNYFHIKPHIEFKKIDDDETKEKYDAAARQCGLSEFDLVLTLAEINL